MVKTNGEVLLVGFVDMGPESKYFNTLCTGKKERVLATHVLQFLYIGWKTDLDSHLHAFRLHKLRPETFIFCSGKLLSSSVCMIFKFCLYQWMELRQIGIL